MKFCCVAAAIAANLTFSPLVAQAQSTSVVLLLRTYSSPTSADEPCIHAGHTEAEVLTLRLTCPSSVQVEGVANTEAGWSLTHEHLAAGPFVLNHYRLQGALGATVVPMELQLVW